MPNSEKSYADRDQKSHALLAALNVFVPVFTPADSAISIVNFTSFLITVGSANEEVENTRSFLAAAQVVRRTASEGAQKLTTQIVNYVKSNPAWKVDFPRIKELCDKARTVRPKAKQPATPPPTPQKPRDRGDGRLCGNCATFQGALGEAGRAGRLHAAGCKHPGRRHRDTRRATRGE